MKQQSYLSLLILVSIAAATVHGGELDAQPIVDTISTSSQTSLISWIWHQITAITRIIWKISSLPILPFWWMAQLIWRHLILTPWNILVQAIYMIYPVLLFCGAACICGLVIGGCSGFAAEALSSALINATWGKQYIDRNKSNAQDDDDTATIQSQDDETEYDARTFDDYDDDQSMGYSEKADTESMDWRHTSRHSPSSSLFRLSFSSTNPNTLSRPSSFYDDKPNDWQGDEDPDEIASFLRQRRRFQQQQQQAAY